MTKDCGWDWDWDWYSPSTWLALGEWIVMLIAGIPAATPPPPPPCSYARKRSWFSENGNVYNVGDGGGGDAIDGDDGGVQMFSGQQQHCIREQISATY